MPKVRTELVEKAVRLFKEFDGKAQVTSMMNFLEHKGLTQTEILEALNQASGGALVRSALGIEEES